MSVPDEGGKSESYAQKYPGGVAALWVISAIILYAALLVAWLLVKDNVLKTPFGQALEGFNEEAWKYIALAEGALITLGTAIWRGLLHDKQTQEQIEQGGRVAEQIELSRKALAETQTNNLAKLFTDATKLLGSGTTEAEKSAGLSLMEIVASYSGKFASEIISVLEAFFVRELGGGRIFELQNTAHNLAIRSLRIIDNILSYYTDYSFGGKDIEIADNKSMIMTPFKKIAGITYRGVTFSGINFGAIPVAIYKDCTFSDCIIVITQFLLGEIKIKGPLLRSKLILYREKYYKSYIKDIFVVENIKKNKIGIEETIFLHGLPPIFTDDEYKEILFIDNDTCFYDSENLERVNNQVYHSPYGENRPYRPKLTFEKLGIKPYKLTDEQKMDLSKREQGNISKKI